MCICIVMYISVGVCGLLEWPLRKEKGKGLYNFQRELGKWGDCATYVVADMNRILRVGMVVETT